MLSWETLKPLLVAGSPVWTLVAGGLVCLLLDALLGGRGARFLYFVGALFVVASLVLAFDHWSLQTIYSGYFFSIDPLTGFATLLILAIGLLSLMNTYSYLKLGGVGEEEKMGGILSRGVVTLILFTLVGMLLLFSSDHLILMFVGLETMSLAIYILVGSHRTDFRSNEAAMKYFIMGSIASAILLYGIVLLYGALGTFSLTELATAQPLSELAYLPRIASALILVGLFFKLGLVPFHFWVPDVYEGAPAPITGFMASGVKVAAFALFIRVLLSFHFMSMEGLQKILEVGVVATLLVGSLGALVQDNVKRMLAYSSIAHAGYLLLGVVACFHDGAFDPTMLRSVLFYLLGYSVMTLGAFAVLSVMLKDNKEVCQFADLAGLGARRPVLSAVLALFMLSLLGFPATVGFVAKYAVLSLAVQNGFICLAIVGVVASVISAFYYLKVLVMMYFREGSGSSTAVPFPLMFSLVFCSVAVLLLGLIPSDYLHMAEQAVSFLAASK